MPQTPPEPPQLSAKDRRLLRTLEIRLKTILPEQYEDIYEDVQPVSMGSAGLVYGADGKVAWGDIWDSFCDLAMAGGPPHKGKLLEPGPAADATDHPAEYRLVAEEIARGIRLASEVAVGKSDLPGWVRVECDDETMAEWILRAVTMENISCRWDGCSVYVPAGAHFRIAKEIKNVITTVAKTTHYWSGHTSPAQQKKIQKAFARMSATQPLIQPASVDSGFTQEQHDILFSKIADRIHTSTGLPVSTQRYFGWLGVQCPGVSAAVWMMRLLTTLNVLSRREDTVLFVPVNPHTDPDGTAVTKSFETVFRFAQSGSIAG